MLSRESYVSLQHESVDTLIERAHSGDKEALGELMARYRGLIRRTAFSVLKNAEDAEDVVQEVALKVLRNLHTCEGKAAFSTWVTRITFNASFAWLRRARCRPSSSLEALSEVDQSIFLALSDTAPSPEARYLAMEIRRRLEQAVSRLPDRLRDVALDHFYEEMSMNEVAQKRMLSLAATKSRSSRARKRLVTLLGTQKSALPSPTFQAPC